MKEKYIGMVRFNDGETVTITFDTIEELDDYVEEMRPYLEKVLLKTRFTFGAGQSNIEIIHAETND